MPSNKPTLYMKERTYHSIYIYTYTLLRMQCVPMLVLQPLLTSKMPSNNENRNIYFTIRSAQCEVSRCPPNISWCSHTHYIYAVIWHSVQLCSFFFGKRVVFWYGQVHKTITSDVQYCLRQLASMVMCNIQLWTASALAPSTSLEMYTGQSVAALDLSDVV